MRKIICPYCFKEFEHDEVHFRLETVKNDGYDISDIEYESDPQKKEEMQLSMYFQPKDDEKYEKFWEKYGGTTELTTQNEQKRFGGQIQVNQLPIIDPKSPEAAKCLKLQNHPDGKSDYFIYDGYNMAQGVEDIDGNTSYRRVCPHCHNPLPNGYGRNEVKFISVIGVTGSGKTVYISQLLKNLPTYTSRLANMASQTLDDRVGNFLNNNPVSRNKPLPDSTMAGKLAQPMTYDIVKSGNKHETIVIYDIAGENCTNANEMQRYGDFVMHSHGIILLISPKQIGITEKYGDKNGDENNTRDAAPPITVLNTIYNTIVAGNSGLCEIPLAVCISKSDIFARLLGDGEENGEEIVEIATSDVAPIQDPATEETRPGFNATQYNVIQKKIAKMLEGDPISVALQTQYKYYNYFIFSAVGCAVRKEERDRKTVSYPVDDPQPVRIVEPLLWLFKRFGYIRSDTHIRLPALRGDPNQKVIVRLTGKQKLANFFNPDAYPPVRGLTADEIKALGYEETL